MNAASPTREHLLDQILVAANLLKPDLLPQGQTGEHAKGKALGQELAVLIASGIAPPNTILAAFGIASRGDFSLGVGLCEGFETALKAISTGTEVQR